MTTDTITTRATLDGASFATALARLRQVGKGRPVTLDTCDGGGFTASVRVTARDSAHGAVSVRVEGTGDLGTIIMAAGVTDLTFPPGPLAVEYGDALRIGPHAIGTESLNQGTYGALTARTPARSVTAPYVEIPAGWFARDVARVVGVASKDPTRPILTGVLVEVSGDGMTVTATDSYRLHGVTFPNPPTGTNLATGPEWSAIVPAPFLARVMREAKRRGADTVTLHHDAGFTWATVSGVEIVASGIEGQYPDYRQLFPVVDEWVGVSTSAVADTLADVTARAKAAGMNAKGGGMLILHREGTGPLVFALSGEWGDVTGDVAECTGPPVERMGVNLDYFRQAVDAMPNDATRLGIAAPLRPITFDSSGANVRALLMPIRIDK